MFAKLKNHINHFLWLIPLKNNSKLQVFLISSSRILYAVFTDLKKGLTSLRAMSLVYTTLLSLVPLLAVSFSVLKGFGAHHTLEPTLLNLFEPLGEKGQQLSQQLLGFVDNTKVATLGSVGLVVLIYTVVSLVKKIETAFNFTWKILSTQNFLQRFSNYLSIILLGPVLLLAAATIKTTLHSSTVVNNFLAMEPFGTLIVSIGLFIPYLLNIISFTFIYKFIPNTQVRLSSAFVGALFATFLWKISGTIFTAFIVNSASYTTIYSGFAILIVFMLWLYVSWLIVLVGSTVSYYYQHPEKTRHNDEKKLTPQLQETLALSIMQLIGNAFFNNQAPMNLQQITTSIGLEQHLTEHIILRLLKAQLVKQTTDLPAGYLPAQALENISLNKILTIARTDNKTAQLNNLPVNTIKPVRDIVARVDKAITDCTKNMTLHDLLVTQQADHTNTTD